MAVRLATTPVSWGIFEFTGIDSGAKIPHERVLDEMVQAGYAGTELGPWGYLPTDPAALKDALDKRGLKLVSALVPIRFADPGAVEAGEAAALRTAALLHALGSPILVLADENLAIQNRAERAGRIRPDDGLSARGWQLFANGVSRVAQKVMDQYGLATAFHNHCGGFVETPAEIYRLMELTKPELVGLCLDTGHYVYGGGDSKAVDIVSKYGPRIKHLHFKDCDPAVLARVRKEGLSYANAIAAGVMCELGKGCVDFKQIAAQITALGYDGYAVVDQDIIPGTGSPLESAQRNRAYLRSVGL